MKGADVLTTAAPFSSPPALSQQAKGSRHSWDIIVMKSEAVTSDEAAFDWDKYPGSGNRTSAV